MNNPHKPNNKPRYTPDREISKEMPKERAPEKREPFRVSIEDRLKFQPATVQSRAKL